MFVVKKTPENIQNYLQQFWKDHYNKPEARLGHTIISVRYVNDNGYIVCDDRIIKIAEELLNQNNLSVNKSLDLDEVYIELHNYYTKDDIEIESDFAQHCDNEAHGCPVNTCIFYLRKDTTLVDGNLIIYDNYDKPTVFNIKPNTIVLMTGELEHEIQPMYGEGIRQCIVVQIPK